MGACARNMYSDSAEIKPAQCCIKLVFHLTYTMIHGNTKLKSVCVNLKRDQTAHMLSFKPCLNYSTSLYLLHFIISELILLNLFYF